MDIPVDRLHEPRTLQLLVAVVLLTDEWVNAPAESRDLLARVARHKRMEDALARLRVHLAATPAGQAGALAVPSDRSGVQP